MFDFKNYLLISIFATSVLVTFLDIFHIFYIVWYILFGTGLLNAILAVNNSVSIAKKFSSRGMERRKLIVEITRSIELISSWLFVSSFSLISGMFKFDNLSLFSSPYPLLGILATIAATVFLSLSICMIWVTLNLKLRSK